LANFHKHLPNDNLTGLEILSNMMQHCNLETQENILTGLKDTMPEAVLQIREKLVFFEDLAYADAAGIQKLIKMLTLKDLAIAVYGSSELLIKNFAKNLSQNRFQDFKTEIRLVGKVSKADVAEARKRIMSIVFELVASKNLFIIKSSDNYYI
jgi:flagellar motor switch protein FliG